MPECDRNASSSSSATRDGRDARNNEFMDLLNARLHGFLDLVTVGVFLLAPFFFGLGGYVAAVAWGLAVVHLLMTLLTRFPLGLVKLIPFPIHGAVEFV